MDTPIIQETFSYHVAYSYKRTRNVGGAQAGYKQRLIVRKTRVKSENDFREIQSEIQAAQEKELNGEAIITMRAINELVEPDQAPFRIVLFFEYQVGERGFGIGHMLINNAFGPLSSWGAIEKLTDAVRNYLREQRIYAVDVGITHWLYLNS